MIGKSGRAEGASDRSDADGKPSGARPLIGIAAGAAVGSAAIAAALLFSGRLRNPFVDAASADDGRRRRADPPEERQAPAAFADNQAGGTGATNVREAGADSIRDREPEREWDGVDEASDESFPASDPPATY